MLDMQPKRGIEYYLYALFEAGVLLKAFNGTWEVVSGLLALLVSRDTILRGFYALAHDELLEDPHDRFVDLVGRFVTTVPEGTRIFIAAYILVHGVINLFLAYQLFRNKLWAYPVAAMANILFLFYQFDRIYLYHSKILMLVTMIDIIFLALLVHEYSHRRKEHNAASTAGTAVGGV